jgi:hypothetical protein
MPPSFVRCLLCTVLPCRRVHLGYQLRLADVVLGGQQIELLPRARLLV